MDKMHRSVGTWPRYRRWREYTQERLERTTDSKDWQVDVVSKRCDDDEDALCTMLT